MDQLWYAGRRQRSNAMWCGRSVVGVAVGTSALREQAYGTNLMSPTQSSVETERSFGQWFPFLSWR